MKWEQRGECVVFSTAGLEVRHANIWGTVSQTGGSARSILGSFKEQQRGRRVAVE